MSGELPIDIAYTKALGKWLCHSPARPKKKETALSSLIWPPKSLLVAHLAGYCFVGEYGIVLTRTFACSSVQQRGGKPLLLSLIP